MQAKKSTVAAAATVAGLAIFGAIAAATGGHSNAGKAFASRPIIRTTVRTTHKVVHVKSKTKRIKVSAPLAAPSRSQVVYAPSAPVAPKRAATAVRDERPDGSGEPQDSEAHRSPQEEQDD